MNRTIKAVCILSLFLALSLSPGATLGLAHASPPQKAGVSAAAPAVPFLKNVGHLDPRVAYQARALGGSALVTKEGEVYYVLSGGANSARGMAFKESFGRALAVGEGRRSGARVSVFKGKDPAGWKAGVPAFDYLELGEVRKGVALRLRASGRNVEKIFTVAPGASAQGITVRVEGADALAINERGELEVRCGDLAAAFTRPAAYQLVGRERRPVEVSYALRGKGEYGFDVGPYDRGRALYIDPLLASTFVGGGTVDAANAVAVDGAGNVYVAGETNSTDFPATLGALDEFPNGARDVFIAKLDPSLSTLTAATFLGGGDDDIAHAIAVDTFGDVYVAGETRSSGATGGAFPTTTGAYDEVANGAADAFVSKLDASLETLIASTFLGGGTADRARSIAIGVGGVFVAGETLSSNFPTTTGAYDETANGALDAFVSNFQSDLSALRASTLLGGGVDDSAYAVALDSAGNVFVAGETASPNFPATTGAHDTSHNGALDAFVTRLNNTLSQAAASTFLGGGVDDTAYAVRPDGAGSVYVAGGTASTDFPTTAGAYDRVHGGDSDAFVSRLAADLSGLTASTLLGGGLKDIAYTLALGGSAVVVAGETTSAGVSGDVFPTTPLAFDRIHGGASDGFVSALDTSLGSLVSSTFLGGGSDDIVNRVALHPGGSVIYAAGETDSTGGLSEAFPTTSGAYQTSHQGSFDVFVSTLSDISVSPSSRDFGDVAVGGSSAPVTVTIRNTRNSSILVGGIAVSDPINFFLDLTAGPSPCGPPPVALSSGQSCTLSVAFTPASSGSFSGSLLVESAARMALLGGTGRGAGASGGCFIATAAYGTALDPHVEALRRFRDRRLLTNAPGRALVAFYYRVSPPIADYIREREPLRAATRVSLMPLIFAVEYPMGFYLAALGLAGVFLARRKRGG
ncbi:MAG: SBBP repeat-containing protein [Thermodesulfovibrionales bacterium]